MAAAINGGKIIETTYMDKREVLKECRDPNSEECIIKLDEIKGTKKHPQSQYDSSNPNEKSDKNKAFYDPKDYNIEEMDSSPTHQEESTKKNK